MVASVVLHAIRHINRVFSSMTALQIRAIAGYCCGLRLVLNKNPLVLFAPSSMQHHTSHEAHASIPLRPVTHFYSRSANHEYP